MSEIKDRDLERFYPDGQELLAPISHYCCGCGEPVRVGEEGYIMPDGNVYCERCVSDSYTTFEEV